ncbi:hypothetical protein LRS10_16410 [Phenylobacterium sp. J426]|uniref:hypothetical protein n=1 Tax=Phenylobacterium sp. J426 TaxID=2898439 RepID=UPI002151E928|nr:hypothetical protein [Phenylobacterium sp. J426]MCR5875619.1 hypothetical protein [Phenylobacterium sp. J426]
MRTAVAMLSLLALGACASAPAFRDEGLATYDAIRDAQQACAAKGLTLKLRDQGDSRRLDHWSCQKD